MFKDYSYKNNHELKKILNYSVNFLGHDILYSQKIFKKIRKKNE